MFILELELEAQEKAVGPFRADKAIREGRIVKTGRHAPNLLRAYPGCGLTIDELINEIGATAACAGVAVELSRPEHVF